MTDRAPTPCDGDPVKQQLLTAALASSAVAAAADAMNPGGATIYDDATPPNTIGTTPLDPSWAPGVFEFTAAVREHLPDGLAAGDFDGVNVQQVLA